LGLLFGDAKVRYEKTAGDRYGHLRSFTVIYGSLVEKRFDGGLFDFFCFFYVYVFFFFYDDDSCCSSSFSFFFFTSFFFFLFGGAGCFLSSKK